MSGYIFGAFYDITRRIPAGKVATYGQIARLAGMPRCARTVGYAMAACRDPSIPGGTGGPGNVSVGRSPIRIPIKITPASRRKPRGIFY